MTRFYDENREAFLVPETIESLVRLAAYEQDPSVQECSLRALTNLALCCMASPHTRRFVMASAC